VALVSYENESHFDDVAIYGFRPASTSQFAVSSPMPDGEFQETYSEPVPLAGGDSPFAHSILSGSLPPGLSMGADGSVTGTPTQIGSWTFDVKVVDSTGRVTAGSVDIDVADTLAPTVTITSPGDQDVFVASSQNLDVDIADHSSIATAEFRLNGGSWTPLTHDTGTHYTAVITLTLGSNMLDVRGIDSETNERIEGIEVFLYLLGDVDGDGDVDEDDALLAAQAEAGLVSLTASQILRADVDKNSTVDIRDAYAIRRKAAGFPLWKD
jgi:hypothetical protein